MKRSWTMFVSGHPETRSDQGPSYSNFDHNPPIRKRALVSPSIYWVPVTQTTKSSQHIDSRYQDSTTDAHGYINFRSKTIIHKRYRVEKQIGKGTFSRVFAAYDMREGVWVALKIGRRTEKFKLAAKIEQQILYHIKKKDKSDESNCAHLNKAFTYKGHPCFVFDLLGRNLYRVLYSNNYFPFSPNHTKSFLKQILEAVKFLHQNQIIYTDLKPENIVFEFDDMAKKRYKNLTIETPKDTSIKLVDFGSACYSMQDHTHLVQTRHYRAPEVVLRIPWNKEIDIWSIGCIAIELITGRMVFSTHNDIDHLCQMEALIGRGIPFSMKKRALNFHHLFDDDCMLRKDRCQRSPVQCRGIHRYFSRLLRIDPNLYLLQDLVDKMLRWNPESRIDAATALKHPYFSDMYE